MQVFYIFFLSREKYFFFTRAPSSPRPVRVVLLIDPLLCNLPQCAVVQPECLQRPALVRHHRQGVEVHLVDVDQVQDAEAVAQVGEEDVELKKKSRILN